MAKERVKLLIGRKEKVDFPKLKLYGINAKIDTGAYTSAIHCDSIRAVRKGGERFVRFRLLDPSHPAYDGREIRKPLLGRRKVKSSFGQTEYRYIIKTFVEIFGKTLRDRALALRQVRDGAPDTARPEIHTGQVRGGRLQVRHVE